MSIDGIHHKRKQIILNGTENWLVAPASSVCFGIYLNSYVTDIKSDLTTLNCMSTHFKATDFNNRYTQANAIAGRTYTITLTFDLDKFTTIEEAKAWLAEQYANNNAVIIEYESSEEIVEAYTEEQQAVYNKLQKLLLYKHYNSITCTDEVNCEMKLTYRPDKILSLQNQIDEIKAQMTSEVNA